MVLWVAQALRALDRMTPYATTTKAQLARTTPTNLTTAGSGLPAFWVDSSVYRGAGGLEKRLSCPGAWTEEAGVGNGTATSRSTREGTAIIRRGC